MLFRSGYVVNPAQVERQIAVLNEAYAGRSSTQTAPTVFQFVTRSVNYIRNSDWYEWDLPGATPENPTPDPDDAEAKTALHQGGYDDLNIYVASLSDQVLGYATFPWLTKLPLDGVVLLNQSLPGGTASGYNEGDTATHEVGHWLGLAHTFENGCTEPGDWVDDTPYQADGPNIFTCRESDDTCAQPGLDPVHNYMSYGDDPCLDRFTAGQSARMTLIWLAYRANVTLT